MYSKDYPGVCFGFSIDTGGPSNYSVRLFFNDHKQQDKLQMIPS